MTDLIYLTSGDMKTCADLKITPRKRFLLRKKRSFQHIDKRDLDSENSCCSLLHFYLKDCLHNTYNCDGKITSVRTIADHMSPSHSSIQLGLNWFSYLDSVNTMKRSQCIQIFGLNISLKRIKFLLRFSKCISKNRWNRIAQITLQSKPSN